MFYSHEVLTSRKYGVATIWLVATLGQKSALKKVSRKDILEVDVSKACETIISPEAPMALRLQGNLLYGVSRVYSQQCGYVLTDAQTTQHSMRMLFSVVHDTELDPVSRTAKREQLLLKDDPNFLPQLMLRPLEIDLALPGLGLPLTSQFSEPSLHTRQTPPSSQIGMSPGSLIIPSSGSSGPSGGGFILPGEYAVAPAVLGEAEMLGGEEPAAPSSGGAALLEDDFFMVDDEGNIVELPPKRTEENTHLPDERADVEMGGMEHHAGTTGLRLDDETNLDLIPSDPLAPAPDSQPVSPPRRLRSSSASYRQSSPTSVLETETRTAPMHRARPLRPIPLDTRIELRNRDLLTWSTEYASFQQRAASAKLSAAVTRLAHKNAAWWILGRGLGGVGAGLGALHTRTPLAEMYAGAGLWSAITGLDAPGALLRGEKRASSEDGEDEEGRRVRAKLDDKEGPGEYNDNDMPLFRGGNDDMPRIPGSDEVEQARAAGSAFDDVSSQMPWNVSASHRGSSLAPVSRLGSLPGSAARLRGRGVSASPLAGRGVVMGDEGDGLSLQIGGEEGPDEALRAAQQEAFELYGPAALVDTQTAGATQWWKGALDREGGNFLTFVEGFAAEKKGQMEEGEGDVEGAYDDMVGFEELLPPSKNSRVVAAQGLLHVLALATKGLLTVQQEVPFGAIRMRVVEAV